MDNDFEDTNLLYRGPGGEQRKLIDQAKRLAEYLGNWKQALISEHAGKNLHVWDAPVILIGRLQRLQSLALNRYTRRYSAYYHTQQEA